MRTLQNNKTFRRFHPIIIVYYIRWVLLVGLLPVFKLLYGLIRGDLMLLLSNLTLEFFIAIIITIGGIIRWIYSGYKYNGEGIVVKDGILLCKETVVKWSKITTIKERRPFYLAIFGACLLKIDTLGGNRKKADMNLYLKTTNSNKIIKKYTNTNHSQLEEQSFHSKAGAILYMALVSINNFIGMFYITTFISQSGRILGKEYADMFVGMYETAIKKVEIGLSPAVIATTYMLIGAWMLGVVVTLQRYYKLGLWCKGNYLTVNGGLVNKQRYITNLENAGYLNIRQNIVSYFVGVCSLFIASAGYGKEKSDILCIIPGEKKNNFTQIYKRLFPQYAVSDVMVRPPRGGFMRYLSFPLFLLFTAITATLLLLKRLGHWREFLLFVGIMVAIPSVLLLLVGWVTYITDGIGYMGDVVTIKYAKWFTLHTAIFNIDKIAKITYTQTIWQRGFGNCDVHFYTFSESKKTHSCKNINFGEIESLLKSLQIVNSDHNNTKESENVS